MGFRIESPYRPSGDQPRAIMQIVDGIQRGLREQTILGATGTGKSLHYDDPVFATEQRAGTMTTRVAPIGPLIDRLMHQHAARVEHQGETELLDLRAAGVVLTTQAFDPASGQVGTYAVSAFTRHRTPATLYRVSTACGRTATMTGDHNLWALRAGRLTLIETADARPTDYLPLPEMITGASGLETLNLLTTTTTDGLYVDAGASLRACIARHGAREVVAALDASGIQGRQKQYAIEQGIAGASIGLAAFRDLLERTKNLDGLWDRAATRIGGKVFTHGLPTSLLLDARALGFFGTYIAEGHSRKDVVIIATHDPAASVRARVFATLLDISHRIAPSSDLRIYSMQLARVLGELCGHDARSKRLPEFWPDLDDPALATLLRAYFDGDGTVERASAISATTASAQLASDLCYALLRFGIWARTSKKWKRATNSDHAGDWYYKVTISGQDDLRRFANQIGFGLAYKQQALEAQCTRDANSNVDIVPLDGAMLRALRHALGRSAREIAELAGLSRAAVGVIEQGHRRPQRRTLMALLDALRTAPAEPTARDAAWWQDWNTLRGFCNVRWTAVASVEPVTADHPYVYDFTVPGAETFLAGRGGFFVHNTFVMSTIFSQLERPALVMAHNKTLVQQLYAEFKELLPDAAVEMFISYYDMYTPEAYVPGKDLYIEKEATINEEIDRLRHAATQALLDRRDVLIVASVSAIYGLGSPQDYGQVKISLRTGEVRNRDKLMRQLLDLQFERNDIDFHRGTFRVRGDVLDIFPANAETAQRVEFWGDEVERITEFDPLTGEVLLNRTATEIYPAKHFITTSDKLRLAMADISDELTMRLQELEGDGKLLEAARLRQRTLYDLEMMGEVGYCSGIENYSRHMDRRAAGQTPWTLIDYFPDDFVLFIDESHISIPQIRGMFNGDKARKQTLVDYGFRLPSAMDNRPLRFEEFAQHIHQAVYVSATPAEYERTHSEQIAELIIRPTGLLDPVIDIRRSKGQIDDLVGEVKQRVAKGQRTLVTTLTKRMAEDLADYLKEMGIRTNYLHSEIETLERVEILRDLRLGVYDVVVGINLLREGLDLPEVSLVAILDADKEGYLRSGSSLIQIIGRAARHIEGRVIMYADTITNSMQIALDETNRRRARQEQHNTENGIVPVGISKAVRELSDRVRKVAEEREKYGADRKTGELPVGKDEIVKLVKDLEKQMKTAAKNLEFEKAASMRDQITELRRTLALEEV